ncbi:hypothetical protein QBC39DRAFT_22118 [Podospora conica]|nr:hypothetical protein QBC39DRAFT_22118 [Schizothecium conicum]
MAQTRSIGNFRLVTTPSSISIGASDSVTTKASRAFKHFRHSDSFLDLWHRRQRFLSTRRPQRSAHARAMNPSQQCSRQTSPQQGRDSTQQERAFSPLARVTTLKMASAARDGAHTQARGQGSRRPTRAMATFVVFGHRSASPAPSSPASSNGPSNGPDEPFSPSSRAPPSHHRAVAPQRVPSSRHGIPVLSLAVRTTRRSRRHLLVC